MPATAPANTSGLGNVLGWLRRWRGSESAEPTTADWSTSPLETLTNITTSYEGALNRWIMAAIDREKITDAIDIADGAKRRRFWLRQGIQAVPSFVVDRRFLIPGAQDPEVFVTALERIASGEAA